MPVVDARTPADQEEFWLFGYGSLIWKPPPHFDRRLPGWVTGYVRRFWQASQDHRGTPDAPGRVVTLIERSYWEQLSDHHSAAPDKVWGTAYRILPDKVAEVKEYLDIREINGYTIHYTPFYPADGSPQIRALVYIGTPQNDQFTGPQPIQALAEHIHRSHGPSGANLDYLLSLENSLAELGPESKDEHVTDLSDRVRGIIRQRDPRSAILSEQLDPSSHGPFESAAETHTAPTDTLTGSISHPDGAGADEQEEIEKSH